MLSLVVCAREAQEVVWVGAGRGVAGLSSQGCSNSVFLHFMALLSEGCCPELTGINVQRHRRSAKLHFQPYDSHLNVYHMSRCIYGVHYPHSRNSCCSKRQRALRKSPLMSSWCQVLWLVCGIES